jgi:hypothetical protein
MVVAKSMEERRVHVVVLTAFVFASSVKSVITESRFTLHPGLTLGPVSTARLL